VLLRKRSRSGSTSSIYSHKDSSRTAYAERCTKWKLRDRLLIRMDECRVVCLVFYAFFEIHERFQSDPAVLVMDNNISRLRNSTYTGKKA